MIVYTGVCDMFCCSVGKTKVQTAGSKRENAATRARRTLMLDAPWVYECYCFYCKTQAVCAVNTLHGAKQPALVFDFVPKVW